MDMTGKYVVVTGAASGFGRATAVAFAKHGAAEVACLDIADEANQTTVKLIDEAGGRGFAVHADFRVVDEIRDAFSQVRSRIGRIDPLVGTTTNKRIAKRRN